MCKLHFDLQTVKHCYWVSTNTQHNKQSVVQCGIKVTTLFFFFYSMKRNIAVAKIPVPKEGRENGGVLSFRVT